MTEPARTSSKPESAVKPLSDAADHYDAVASTYHEQYERQRLYTADVYPANYFRLQLLINSMTTKGVKKLYEVGVGEGTPIATLARAGIDVWGCDISHKMVERARENVKSAGLDSARISWGDIQDSTTYAQAFTHAPFDALIAMGVLPHVKNDDLVLDNMSALIKPGGTVFVEFRNKLFSLFTFNRHTFEFIMDDLLADTDPALKASVAKEIQPRLRMDLPPVRDVMPGSGKPGYDAILSRFHNPFEVPALFKRHGFDNLRYHWYHYHAAPPLLERAQAELFRAESIRLEHEPSGWRGFFLCSAFVIEADKAI